MKMKQFYIMLLRNADIKDMHLKIMRYMVVYAYAKIYNFYSPKLRWKGVYFVYKTVVRDFEIVNL